MCREKEMSPQLKEEKMVLTLLVSGEIAPIQPVKVSAQLE